MNLDDYRKVQKLKKLGLSQKKIMEETGLKEYDVRRCWNRTEDEFKVLLDRIGPEKISLYKDYVLDILKVTPTIPDTNIYYKLLEDFPNADIGESAFRKYMKKLRKETGYDRFRKISTSIRENPEPGEEAQIDFGQYKIIDMYGKRRFLYFFVMVLRYSQLKFVYFSTTDFNTMKAIEAHKMAFKFFGGIPKVLVYDQDKVFAVAENYGNLVLVKEFEDFLKEYNLHIVMCSGYYPQGKGTVENYVKIVKENFLGGRIYHGIDSLNSACLEWLDNTLNNHILSHKGVTPHELFKEESKKLKKIKPLLYSSEKPIYKVQRNYIKYRYSRYEVPIGYEDMNVGVESDGFNVIIKDLETDQIIATHKLSTKKDERMTLNDEYEVDGVGEYVVKRYFKDDINAMKFLDSIEANQKRYFKKSCVKIKRLIRIYSKEEMDEAFTHCVNNGRNTILELIAFLIFKHGEVKGAKALGKSTLGYYLRRSKEIMEELNGQ